MAAIRSRRRFCWSKLYRLCSRSARRGRRGDREYRGDWPLIAKLGYGARAVTGSSQDHRICGWCVGDAMRVVEFPSPAGRGTPEGEARDEGKANSCSNAIALGSSRCVSRELIGRRAGALGTMGCGEKWGGPPTSVDSGPKFCRPDRQLSLFFHSMPRWATTARVRYDANLGLRGSAISGAFAAGWRACSLSTRQPATGRQK